MRWLRKHDTERWWRPNVRAFQRGTQGSAPHHRVHIALLGALLLIVGCGPPRAVVVPNEWLSTWPIHAEPVQTETAAPFVERIDLRAATLQFPYLTGVVDAIHAPWLVGVLQKPLSLDTREGLRIDSLPAIQPAENGDGDTPNPGVRVMVTTPGPFPSRIELRSATLVNSQLSGVVHSIDSATSIQAVGQPVTLDVRKLSKVIVYRANARAGQKLAGSALLPLYAIGIGLGGLLLAGLVITPIVCATKGCGNAWVPRY